MPDRPGYVLTLRPAARWTAATELARLRRLCKAAARVYGFELVGLVSLTEDRAPRTVALNWDDNSPPPGYGPVEAGPAGGDQLPVLPPALGGLARSAR